MTARFTDHILSGDHASRPLPDAVPVGATYDCETHACTYRSDGTAWTLHGAPGVIWIAAGGTVPADTPVGTLVVEASA